MIEVTAVGKVIYKTGNNRLGLSEAQFPDLRSAGFLGGGNATHTRCGGSSDSLLRLLLEPVNS